MNKLLSLALVLFSALVLFAAVPHLALADSPAKNQIRQGACDAAQQANCGAGASTTDINKTIKSVINILSVIVGVAAVIMIIIGGFRYVTSGGASEKITAAKNTLLYAIIGLIIVALAQIIARFVLTSVAK